MHLLSRKCKCQHQKRHGSSHTERSLFRKWIYTERKTGYWKAREGWPDQRRSIPETGWAPTRAHYTRLVTGGGLTNVYLLSISVADPDPVLFWPLDPGSGIGFSGSRISDRKLIFLRAWWKFFEKKFHNSLKIGSTFFLQHFKNKIKFNYVKFVTTKKGMTTNFF